MPAVAAAEDTFTLTFQDQEVLAAEEMAEPFKAAVAKQEPADSAAAAAEAENTAAEAAADQE